MERLYLASRSPRRRELLDQIAIRYRTVAVSVDETPQTGESPSELAIRLALAKAKAGQLATADHPLPVLGADTVVTLEGQILGKPSDAREAVEMLLRLAGHTHRVITGVALGGRQTESCVSISEVRFRSFGESEARAYVATGEPMDKAGSYGIQGRGALFVERLEGSYSGVMGLPLHETGQLLSRAGVPLWPPLK